MDNSTSGAVFGILLVAALAYSDALGDLTDETISYEAKCLQDGDRQGCYTLNRTTYRVRPASGEVVYWATSDDYSTPRRLANCSIRDSEHWQCEYHDGSGPVVMLDGIEARTKGGGRASIGLRWWQWHALRLSNMVGSKLMDWPPLLTPDQVYCEFAGNGAYRFTYCEPVL